MTIEKELVECEGLFVNGELQLENCVIKYLDPSDPLRLYNGRIMEGTFNRNGHGILKYKDGKIVEGEFNNNRLNGEGVIQYPNGDVFEGEFLNGQRHGDGVMFYNDKKETFRGVFRNDEQNGWGELTKANGEIYKGNWKGRMIMNKEKVEYPEAEEQGIGRKQSQERKIFKISFFKQLKGKQVWSHSKTPLTKKQIAQMNEPVREPAKNLEKIFKWTKDS